MTDTKHEKGGYYYVVSKEQIRAYLAVSPLDRLRWLADGNQWLATALTGKRRQAWQAFRDGKIG